ncbi:MAG: response regulator transcription factor [Oscillospiraceae bacterium]|nr:response regulator transcription factor [Oscillospiraceae bacterium]
MNRKIRVLIIDDQNIARGYFRMYVESSDKYELAGALSEAEKAVLFCDNGKADLVVMDIMMRSGIDGVTAAEQIKKRHPEIKIILVTSTSESAWEKRARASGIEGFWYKEYSETSLFEVMDRIMAGEHVYPDSNPAPEFGRITRAELTDREIDVLRELTGSRSNDEIAGRLGISVNTVRQHIQNMLNKTGYQNRLDLAINATAIGIVVSDSNR